MGFLSDLFSSDRSRGLDRQAADISNFKNYIGRGDFDVNGFQDKNVLGDTKYLNDLTNKTYDELGNVVNRNLTNSRSLAEGDAARGAVAESDYGFTSPYHDTNRAKSRVEDSFAGAFGNANTQLAQSRGQQLSQNPKDALNAWIQNKTNRYNMFRNQQNDLGSVRNQFSDVSPAQVGLSLASTIIPAIATGGASLPFSALSYTPQGGVGDSFSHNGTTFPR